MVSQGFGLGRKYRHPAAENFIPYVSPPVDYDDLSYKAWLAKRIRLLGLLLLGMLLLSSLMLALLLSERPATRNDRLEASHVVLSCLVRVNVRRRIC
jgi:hypothetical protein